jgi:DNA-binding beta-propeller fold protein YncE
MLVLLSSGATMGISNWTGNAESILPHQYTFAFKWGSMGTADGQFLSPHGIAIDSQGYVYVSDRDRNDIQKFTSNGTFVKKWGTNGSALGQFNHPYEIEIDALDNLYIVDKNNNRIQVFDKDGNFIRVRDTAGGSNSKFSIPEAIAMDPRSGAIYITDTGNNRVVKLSHEFDFIMEWGGTGTGKGQFDHPHGIDLDSTGNVYVNEIISRIQKFDSNGKFITQWGNRSDGEDEFAPHNEHLVVDSKNFVWQVDGEEKSRLVKFDSNGKFITRLGSGPCIIEEEIKRDKIKMGEKLPCDGRLNAPEHAAVNSSGSVYVVDRGNQRIVVYLPLSISTD